MKKLALSLIATIVLSTAAMADSHHKGHETKNHQSGHKTSKDGIHAEGRLHAMDGKNINISHGPIKDIGWPAMRMDLPVLEGAEVGDVKAGDDVIITLEKSPDGFYGIKAIEPKK